MQPISYASVSVVVQALARLASLLALFDNMMSLPEFSGGPAASGTRANQERLARRWQCVGNICPWCILDARHGYLEEAM